MRDRVIAVAVCAIIFAAVLAIGIVTVTRGNMRSQTVSAKSGGTQTAENQTPEPPPPPPKKYKYKRSNLPDIYPPFEQRRNLTPPANINQYTFKAGILADLDSHEILWEKNSAVPVPIASMSKLLTMYTAFEEIERIEDVTLNTLVTVSRECTLVAPVKINLKPGEKHKLSEIFTYTMLKSSNDAAHLIAEYFGYGESSRFIALMNQKAQDIGMTSSKFFNANGLTIYKQSTNETFMNTASCQDMLKLIERIYEYPAILRYTSSRKASSRYGELSNGNRLLGMVQGVNGMKTGYTNAAGHCLSFSCIRNGRRLIGVLTGFSKRQNCFDCAAKLIEWGYKN